MCADCGSPADFELRRSSGPGDDCFHARLSRKGGVWAAGWRVVVVARGVALGGGGGVLVEFEEVVGGGDEAPFGACGGSAASGEARERAVVFGVAEDRLD